MDGALFIACRAVGLFFSVAVLFALPGKFVLIPVLLVWGLGLVFCFSSDYLFLFFFCPGIFFHKHGCHGKGINAGIIHQSGKGGWCGRKYLDLFRCDVKFVLGKVLQFIHFSHATTGMGSDQVIGQVLFFIKRFTNAVKLVFERKKAVHAWFSHKRQHTGRTMFRCKLHLAGDMIGYYLF